MLRVNRIAYPIDSLGFGRRIALWVQGCDIGCSGCASLDMWDAAGGEEIEAEDLAVRLARAAFLNNLCGLSISGGEPTNQPEALACMVKHLRKALRRCDSSFADDFDVLVFTGREADEARSKAPQLWETVDALVCGPYMQELPRGDALRATSNQTIECVSGLGRIRYALPVTVSRKIQTHVGSDGSVVMAGITDSGDLGKMKEMLLARGINLEECSWEN